MHRFFVHIPLQEEIFLETWDLYHQITHVFRARVGDSILLFSEWTDDYRYEIQSISKKSLSLCQKEIIKNTLIKSKTSLTVIQAYPNKISTMELLVQKFSELGVEKVVFWKSEYAQLSAVSEVKKIRIDSIAREALEQCGGNTSLLIDYSSESLPELFHGHINHKHIVGHYEWAGIIPKDSSGANKKALWIGPEWGWSSEEKGVFQKNNMFLWKFNDRILRLETAAIVGAGIILR